MRNFEIYNSFKYYLFYEMKRKKLEKCWFWYYYDHNDFGMFHFKATDELCGNGILNISINIDKSGCIYYDELVDIFKLHEDWLFEISEYDYDKDAFDIIFKKPIYSGFIKEYYHISNHLIIRRYDINYNVSSYCIDDARYTYESYNNTRLRLAMNSVYGLDSFNPLRDISVNDIRKQLQLPTITSSTAFYNAPKLSKSPIFNPPATICYWTDGTKTVVKCQEEDTYSPEAGLALCYMKKVLGNTSRDLNKELHKYISEEEEDK